MDTQAQSTGERGQEANGDARSDRELREANRHLREFLGLLGHELRSPLAAIRNALQLLERQGDDAVTRERVRGMMDRQTQSIGRLVEDMLEVSRIEHGTIPLRRQALDLADVVARAIETVRASVENCGHRLEVSLPPVPVTLNADPARLEQVLTNLLNNAAKYMERGGRIWVTAEALGATWCCVSGTAGSASIRLCSRMCSIPSGSWSARSVIRRADWGSGCRWCESWRRCTGAARARIARAWAVDASSSCVYPYIWRFRGTAAAEVTNSTRARP
jgi:signal transduction histidine kinase